MFGKYENCTLPNQTQNGGWHPTNIPDTVNAKGNFYKSYTQPKFGERILYFNNYPSFVELLEPSD